MNTRLPDRPAMVRSYRYFELVMVAFVAVFLCSNLIGPAKAAQIDTPWLAWLGVAHFAFGAGVLFFPLSYVFGDILTEVYGYARARKVIWAGFGALIFASLMAWTVTSLPAAKTMSPESNARFKVAVIRSGESPTYSAQSNCKPRACSSSMNLGKCLSARLPERISSPTMMRPNFMG